jgi:hypothetical protein
MFVREQRKSVELRGLTPRRSGLDRFDHLLDITLSGAAAFANASHVHRM